MNGYKLMADSYQKAIEQGKFTEAEATPSIRIYEFLSECTNEDFYRLVDSTAFNEIIKAYCSKALQNAKVGDELEREVLQELRLLFDERTAKEICEE